MASAAKMDKATRLLSTSDAPDDGSTGSGGGSAPERRMLPMDITDRVDSDDPTRGQTSVLTSAAKAVASAARRASTAVVSAAVGPASPTGSLPSPATAPSQPSQPCLHKKRVFLCVPCAIIGGVILIICLLFKDKFTVGLLDQQMVGTWKYGDGSSQYTISHAFFGALQFDEVHKSGRPATGKLEKKDEFWQGNLKFTDNKESAGTIRLRLSPVLVSQLKHPGRDEWDNHEWRAYRVDPIPGALNGNCRPEGSNPRCNGGLVCDTSSGTCIEKEAAEAGLLHQQMVGTWHDGDSQYTISPVSPDVLQFDDEDKSSSRLSHVSGELKQEGKFWEGDLNFDNKESAWTIRLHLSPELVSQFKAPGEDEWDHEGRAYRVDPMPAPQ